MEHGARYGTERDDAQEVRSRAEQAAAAILEQTRAQAQFEADRIRAHAEAQARQIVDEGEQRAAALLDEAHAELARLREQALSVVERVKTTAVEHANEITASEAVRLRQEAIEEAQEVKAAIIDVGRKEAQRLLSEAEREKQAILEKARDDAVPSHAELAADPGAVPGGYPRATLLRAGEIASREFPVTRRGFDPDSVRRWLELVEASYSTLEEELHRARREWERVLEILEVTRSWVALRFPDATPQREGRLPSIASQGSPELIPRAGAWIRRGVRRGAPAPPERGA